MPELPEMETYKRLLGQRILQQRILDVEIHREKTVNVAPQVFHRQVQGKSVVDIQRRGKHLLFHLDSGYVLLLHLMLGGWMYYGTLLDKPKNNPQVTVSYGLQKLYFLGLHLGYLHALSPDEAAHRLRDLGPEPLDDNFTVQAFEHILRSRRGNLKGVLTNQKIMAGIGNCYSDEMCFEAGILPSIRATDLSADKVASLYRCLHEVLHEAMEVGGYQENPLFLGDTLTGGYNSRCRVYDRGGEPCLRCGTPIIQTELNKRKLFYCPVCQH